MIKMFCAHTEEIDDVNLAVDELMSQLPMDQLLLRSVGIVTCYNEFIFTGVITALAQRLPFELIGCTTMAGGSAGACGDMLLCLAVLTADDVAFACAISDPIAEGNPAPLQGAYRRAAETLGEAPKLLLSFLPMLPYAGGEVMMRALDEVSGGVPSFGMIACDKDLGMTASYTLLGGENHRDAAALLLIAGDIDPQFFVAAISDEMIQKQRATITDARGNQLRRVNGTLVTDYLTAMGLDISGPANTIGVMPLVLDYNDGTPPALRSIYAFTPEGYAQCGGDMPQGATLSIGLLSPTDILQTTARAVRDALATGKRGGLLCMPCLSRLLGLGVDAFEEMQRVSELAISVPYLLAYSAGELCPLYGERGAVNRFHNFSFVACVF
ncbi:MAG: FIST C-terminal domain-containing protein [Oscillospiraceae bacterium]|jgi:hypothetical protein|nr:FIST C-terminal domain-containing protein [Oscillospiraceae bacterium]